MVIVIYFFALIWNLSQCCRVYQLSGFTDSALLRSANFLVRSDRACNDCATVSLECRSSSGALTCKYENIAVPTWCSARNCATCVSAAVGALALPRRSPRIFLIIPFFGNFLNYFQLYLDSLERNSDVLTVFLLSDVDLSPYRLPSNLVVVRMTFEQLRLKTVALLSSENATVTFPPSFMSGAYKLVDFKPLLAKLFTDVLQVFRVREYDFVGYGDCDLIYGRLSDFWREEHHSVDIIGGFHGHFVAWKNTNDFRNLYRAVPNLYNILLDEKVHIMDEIAFRQPLLSYLERSRLRMFYINAMFLDIVPPMFYGLFRSDHQRREKNFFDVYHANTDISSIYCNTTTGRISVRFDDNSTMQCAYVHLQKRPMQITWSKSPADGFFVTQNSFEGHEETS